VLLVEDNEMNWEMLSRRLRRRGYEVSVAVNGRIGIEMAFSGGPDIILMDLNLPEIDGWEATSILKNDERSKHIPIIGLTAHAMVTDKQKALDAGCDEFATKPIEFNRLLEKMNALLLKAAA